MAAGLTPQIKADLALLYELPQFKSFVKYCRTKRLLAAEKLLAVNMREPGAAEQIASLQGQALVFQFLEADLRRIHKEQTTKVDTPKRTKKV